MELVSPLLTNLLALTAIVGGLAFGIWFIIGLYWLHSREKEEELPEADLPGHLHEVFTGSPPVITIFIIFIGLSLIAYVLYIWLGGISY